MRNASTTLWAAGWTIRGRGSTSAFNAAEITGFAKVIGDLIEARDVSAVALGELRQPYVCALGNQHCIRHPVNIGAEPFVFVGGIAQARHLSARG